MWSFKQAQWYTLNLFIHVILLFTNGNDKKLARIDKIHEKKLFNLGLQNTTSINPDEVILNFTSYSLSSIEKSILAKGLNFSVPPKRLNYGEYMLPFELLFRSIKQYCKIPGEVESLRSNLKSTAFNSFKSYDFRKELNLTQKEFEQMENLSKRNDLVIQKADKGNCVVILNKTDYVSRLEEMLSDTSKYEHISIKEGKLYSFMVKQEQNILVILNNLLKKGSYRKKPLNA